MNVFQFNFILVNVGRFYDIVPIKRLRKKKTKLHKDTQQMLYVHKRLKENKGHQRFYIRNKTEKEEQEVQNTFPLKSGGKGTPQRCQLFHEYE